MPVQQVSGFNHYTFRLAALENAKGVAPNVPKRNYLYIQNMGVNALRLQFGRAAGNVSDITIGPGQDKEWDTVVPIDSINLFSTAGTFGIIVEGRTP